MMIALDKYSAWCLVKTWLLRYHLIGWRAPNFNPLDSVLDHGLIDQGA